MFRLYIIAQFFEAINKHSQIFMNGRSFLIHNNGDSCDIFNRLMQFLYMIRYHSLIVELHTVLLYLEIIEWSIRLGSYKESIGIHHRSLFIEGIQFHSESILIEQRYKILFNFMNY